MSLSFANVAAANFVAQLPLDGSNTSNSAEPIDSAAAFIAGLLLLLAGLLIARMATIPLAKALLAKSTSRPHIHWRGAEIALAVGAIIVAIPMVGMLLKLFPTASILASLIATEVALLLGSIAAVAGATLVTRREVPELDTHEALNLVAAGMGLAAGEAPSRQAKAALFGVLGLVLSLPVIFGAMSINPFVLKLFGLEFATQEVLSDLLALSGPALAGGLLLATFAGPVLEEVLFRGFMQPLAVQSLGPAAGVFLTSVVFGLIHGPAAFLPVFSLSLLLGYLRLRTGYLLPAIIAHCLWNAGTMALSLSNQPSF